jgi:site-specific recombinase XerD
MMHELQLRGYADRTAEAYVGVVAQLAQFYHTSPDQLTEEQLRAYLLHLSTVRKVASSSLTVALSGLKFFYEKTLGRQWKILDVARAKRDKKLPVVLSRDEVWCVLAAVRNPGYRACLTTMYACGLRLLEGARLEVADVDGARKLVHVHHGKGGRDRFVPLPDAALALLRAHWRTHRHPRWLFPAPPRHPMPPRRVSERPVGESSLQKAFGRAVQASGVRKRAHVHTLRHSYATHLVESGVPLPLVPEYLGHSDLSTTAVYTHMTRELRDAALDPINGLMPPS